MTLTACGGDDNTEGLSQSQLERMFPGGETTIVDNTFLAFGTAAPNLTEAQVAQFDTGDLDFDAKFVSDLQPAGPTQNVQTGVGPLFNANACVFCHKNDGRGHLPVGTESPQAIFLRVSLPGTDPGSGGPLGFPGMGDQMQNHANVNIKPEADLKITYEEQPGTFADGETYSLRKPTYTVDRASLATAVTDQQWANFLTSPRLAPPIVGRGLLEAIPEADILAQQDIDDADGDGISGKANLVWHAGQKKMVLGRIGLKANNPDLAQQNAGAYRGDMGVTNPYFSVESCEGQIQCADPTDPDKLSHDGVTDIDERTLADVNFYTRTVAVPAPRGVGRPQVERGLELFKAYNCVGCHVDRWVTGEHPDHIAALENQVIYPYTDLLLHDMGDDLADGRPDFLADGNEWRTPPLWGLGLTETISGNHPPNGLQLLHDGRARTIPEAILWHAGEAKDAKEQFQKASKEDREALITFLQSL